MPFNDILKSLGLRKEDEQASALPIDLFPKPQGPYSQEFLDSLKGPLEQSLDLGNIINQGIQSTAPKAAEIVEPIISEPIQEMIPTSQPQIPIEQVLKKSEVKAPSISRNPASEPIKQEESKEEPGLKELDLTKGTPTEYSTSELQRLQDEAKQARGLQQLGRAATLIGGGIAQASPDLVNKLASGYEGSTEADQAIKDYLTRVEGEKKDPNSSISQGLKSFLKSTYGYDIKGDISAADLEKTIMGPLVKSYEQQQTRDAKSQLEELKREAASEKADSALNLKQMQIQLAQQGLDLKRENIDKLIGSREKMGAIRLAETAAKNIIQGGGRPVEQDRVKIRAADTIRDTVIRGMPEFENTKTPPTLEELAKLPASKFNYLNAKEIPLIGIELNNLVSKGGVPPVTTLEHIIPKNLQMDKAALEGYLSSGLPPAQQGVFIKTVIQEAVKHRKSALNRVKDIENQFKNTTKLLEPYLSPEERQVILNTGYSGKQETSSPIGIKSQEDLTALDWAKEKISSGTPEEKRDAMDILKANGVL